MKPRTHRLISRIDIRNTPCSRIVVTCLAVSAIALSSPVSAADGAWTGGDSATWDTTDTNWSGVLAGTPWDITNGTTNRAVFSTAGATPVISGSVYTNGMSITETVTLSGGTDLNLVGTTPIIDASADASISSVIAGTSVVTKAGTGALTLSGVNTYSGGTTINAGNVTVENNQSGATGGWSIGPASTATTVVNFASSSTVTVASGKQIRIGNVSSNGTLNSALNVAGVVTNSGTLLMGRSSTLILNNGANWTQSGNMSQTVFGGFAAALTINSGASMTYSGANTVKLNLNNGSSSNAILTINGTGLLTTGAGFENAINGTATGNNRVTLAGGGTVKLSADVTNLTTQTQFTLGTGGGVIDNNSFNTTLSGIVTAGYGTLATGISGTGGLTSQGSGTLTLSGVNTYTGITTVSSGTVTVQNDQSAATGGWNIQTPNNASAPVATVHFSAASTIAVASDRKIQIGAAANSGSHPASTLNVAGTVTNSGALQMERASNLNLNSSTVWDQAGNLTVTARGGSSATLNVNAGAEMTYSGATTVKLNNSGTSGGSGSLNINGTGRFTTAVGFENTSAITTGNGVSRVTLSDGGTLRLSANVTDLTTQTRFILGNGGGVIDNNGFSTTLSGVFTGSVANTTTGITGAGSLTSTGGGTLTLSGLNTYSGNTTVSGGTLTLAQINASNESSTVSIASGAVLNLTFDGTDTVDKLFLNGVQQPLGVYGSGNSGGRITGTGTLTVSSGPASGFTTWIAGFAVGGQNQPGDDADNDGMDNLVEFVLNGNPTVSDNSILPTLNVTATDFEFTYQRRDDSVSPETTQTFQWGTTLATWPGSAVIPATSATVGAATITVSPGVPNDAVTDTVKISIPKTEAGGSGKLFGRLQVVKP